MAAHGTSSARLPSMRLDAMSWNSKDAPLMHAPLPDGRGSIRYLVISTGGVKIQVRDARRLRAVGGGAGERAVDVERGRGVAVDAAEPGRAVVLEGADERHA